MLSERQLEALLERFTARMQGVTDEYLRRMGEHLRDIGALKPSDVHILTEMKRVGVNADAIMEALVRAANISVQELAQAFEKIAENDEGFMREWFQRGFKPVVKGPMQRSVVIERILKAQLRITAQEFKNLSQTTVLTDSYRKAVDVAVQTVQSGITDYNSAIRSAMKQAAQDGLRVQYPNSGLTRRLDTAVRQNVLDGVRALNHDILQQIGNELGADGVEISAHALCAEDHLPYQGRQYSQKEFDRIQDMLRRPFGMWNCKHTITPIILGVSEPAYTEEELEDYRRNSSEVIEIDGVSKTRYEWSQQQRRIETAVRYQKDIAVAAKASGDMPLRREAQAKINGLQRRYNRISEAAGLSEQRERMSVSGFRRVKTAVGLKKPAKDAKIQMAGQTVNTRPAAKKTLQVGTSNGIIVMADSSPRFERVSGALKQSYRDSLAQRFASGDPAAQRVYDKFIPAGGAVYDGAYKGVAHYSPSSNMVSMNFASDARNKRGAGTAWFHEHGHYIDTNAGKVSRNLNFAQAIVRDCREYEKMFRKTHKLHLTDDVRRGISYELCGQGDVTHSIQDIFGGSIGKPYPGAQWSHKATYWKSHGPVGVCSEAFAHMFEASFSPDKRALMQKYFPTAWAEFEKILGGIV